MTETQKKMRRDLIWNMIGSLTYALASMVLAFFVMNLLGPSDGGIFGFGFSTFGQQMFIVAYFGIRPFQITDVRFEYSFAEYRRARVCTSLTAFFGALLYLSFLFFLGRYSLRKAGIILLLALYKIFDGYADVYESEYQRTGKLYRAGQLLTLRTLFCAGGLALFVLLSGNLLFAAAAAALLQLCFMGYYRASAHGLLIPARDCGSRKTNAVTSLLSGTLLLFLSVFLDFYIFSASKYAIDSTMSDRASGIYNILFMPTSVIYLAVNFVIRPFMTELAEAFERRDFRRFSEITAKLQLLIVGLTMLAYAAACLLGGPVLRLGELILGEAYEGSLVPYRAAFSNIIFGGGIYALANLYYYILVILRKQKAVFLIYAVLSAAAALVTPQIVGRFGLNGAAISYELTMLLLCAGFYFVGKKLIREETACRKKD